MTKVRMSIRIDAQTRKMLDALTVQAMIAGAREGYSLLIEKAVQEYFEKNAQDDAWKYVKNSQDKLFK